MEKRIIVIGGGAAGLVAAISAAREGAAVTLLEAKEKPGKKLLVTGNGRCNLTNRVMEKRNPAFFEALLAYEGSGSALAKELFSSFEAEKTLSFFEKLGLLTQEKNGYLYPCTGQASSVLEVLLSELRRRRVKLKLSQRVVKIEGTKEEGFLVHTDTWAYEADAVILACGSAASPATGAVEDGYHLAKNLGHALVTPKPALVPLVLEGGFFPRVAGVRSRARLSLYGAAPDLPLLEETGELQWTNYGISGIAVFQLSRHIARWQGATDFWIGVDLLPDYSKEAFFTLLFNRAAEWKTEPVSTLLRGIVQEKLIPVLLDKKSRQLPDTCGALLEEDILYLVKRIRDFRLKVKKTKDLEQAQICVGGVDCAMVSERLESRIRSGIYFAGELLDVDGPCGGFNLQWAFTSGYLSGIYAVRG